MKHILLKSFVKPICLAFCYVTKRRREHSHKHKYVRIHLRNTLNAYTLKPQSEKEVEKIGIIHVNILCKGFK